jgi:hypothetical protein
MATHLKDRYGDSTTRTRSHDIGTPRVAMAYSQHTTKAYCTEPSRPTATDTLTCANPTHPGIQGLLLIRGFGVRVPGGAPNRLIKAQDLASENREDGGVQH